MATSADLQLSQLRSQNPLRRQQQSQTFHPQQILKLRTVAETVLKLTLQAFASAAFDVHHADCLQADSTETPLLKLSHDEEPWASSRRPDQVPEE